MNFDLKELPKKLIPIFEKVKKYKNVVVIIIIAFIFSFLIVKINGYTNVEPTEEAVDEKLTTVTRPRIDENAVKKIEQLEDQNVEVQALFTQARENPFSE